MGDRSAALAAVWMVEHGHADERIPQSMREYPEPGFLAQLANRALQQTFSRLEESARYLVE